MFFLWLLMGIGFIASVVHSWNRPLQAFNSLKWIGASGLSNEIAASCIFFAVGGLWWLVAVIGKMPQRRGDSGLLRSMALRRHFGLDDDLRVSNGHRVNLA
ncbi:DmsC/YnfH family molybdoenzyme membrane anchor subunit [Shigella flexneri]